MANSNACGCVMDAMVFRMYIAKNMSIVAGEYPEHNSHVQRGRNKITGFAILIFTFFPNSLLKLALDLSICKEN